MIVRWTIGDVSDLGFEALRLSVHGAVGLFGNEASYFICLNSLSEEEGRRRAGTLPEHVRWLRSDENLPRALSRCIGPGMTEGTAWKLVPLQVAPGRRELALDNDVILWRLPSAMEAWLGDSAETATLIAADVTPAHGQFAGLCGSEPKNSGIRGTPAEFDLEAAITEVLEECPVTLSSELDEQGLQIAALCRHSAPYVVTTGEVSICSPFYPHQAELGSCGAHFVGLNARAIPWDYYDRPAIEMRREHWMRHRPELYARVGLGLPRERRP